MCSGTEAPTCLCEDCEAMVNEWNENNTIEFDESKYCPVCKENLTRFCWACGKLYDRKAEACLEYGACKTCREE